MGETRGKVPMDLALLSSGLKAGCAPTNKKPPHSRVIQLVVTMTKDRVNEIDLLRFIAAIVVLFFHYSFRGACLRRSVHHALPLDYSSCTVWISGGSAVFHDQRLRDVDGQWTLFSYFYSIPRQHDDAQRVHESTVYRWRLLVNLHRNPFLSFDRHPVGRPTPRSGAASVFILIVFICTDIHDRQQKRAHLRVGPSRPPGRADFAW